MHVPLDARFRSEIHRMSEQSVTDILQPVIAYVLRYLLIECKPMPIFSFNLDCRVHVLCEIVSYRHQLAIKPSDFAEGKRRVLCTNLELSEK